MLVVGNTAIHMSRMVKIGLDENEEAAWCVSDDFSYLDLSLVFLYNS